jgi:hypothetical protein
VLIANDDLIAGILNRNGLVTGNGNRWTRRASDLAALQLQDTRLQADTGKGQWVVS